MEHMAIRKRAETWQDDNLSCLSPGTPRSPQLTSRSTPNAQICRAALKVST
jgi:hypothetical protein